MAQAEAKTNGADPGAQGSYTAERAKLTGERALTAKINREALEGSLVPADQVDEVWQSLTSLFRTSMLGLPAKCAARIGMCKTVFRRGVPTPIGAASI